MQFEHPLGSIVSDLLKNDSRKVAWDLIDHYYSRATSLSEFDTLGKVAFDAEKRDTYLKCAEAVYALAKSPEQRYNARINLYKAYNTMNYPEKALFYIDQNLQLNPNDFDAQCARAFNISLMGRKEEAESILMDIAKKNPDKIKDLDSAFSGKLLRSGQLAKGIISFLHSFKPENKFFSETMGMKRWEGMIQRGRTIYVDCEGGIGDQIINIRFFDRIKKLGMNPILVSADIPYYRDINALLKRHDHEVLTEKFMVDKKQLWTPMMSIPGFLGLQEKDLWKGQYLFPLRQEKNELPNNGRPRIGIKCSGNPYFGQDEYRKIPPDQMLAILPKDADIYYIDKEAGPEGTISLSDKINSWEDTLDFIDQMDCIVSSCTSLVHAAGAMNKKTFVAVPIAEYYIWTTSKTDGSSPWYSDNMYVARQSKLRDWSEPLSDIGMRVKQFLECK